jgi:hypothetical protein
MHTVNTALVIINFCILGFDKGTEKMAQQIFK